MNTNIRVFQISPQSCRIEFTAQLKCLFVVNEYNLNIIIKIPSYYGPFLFSISFSCFYLGKYNLISVEIKHENMK